MTERRATLDVTEELVRAYSRRGNFHSDAETATALGLPGLVAQGVQMAGPAYTVRRSAELAIEGSVLPNP